MRAIVWAMPLDPGNSNDWDGYDVAYLTVHKTKFLRPKRGRWYWRLTHSNGEILASSSSKTYVDRDECLRIGRKVCGGEYRIFE